MSCPTALDVAVAELLGLRFESPVIWVPSTAAHAIALHAVADCLEHDGMTLADLEDVIRCLDMNRERLVRLRASLIQSIRSAPPSVRARLAAGVKAA